MENFCLHVVAQNEVFLAASQLQATNPFVLKKSFLYGKLYYFYTLYNIVYIEFIIKTILYSLYCNLLSPYLRIFCSETPDKVSSKYETSDISPRAKMSNVKGKFGFSIEIYLLEIGFLEIYLDKISMLFPDFGIVAQHHIQ